MKRDRDTAWQRSQQTRAPPRGLGSLFAFLGSTRADDARPRKVFFTEQVGRVDSSDENQASEEEASAHPGTLPEC